MEIDVPQDRKSTFEPQVVRNRQKDRLEDHFHVCKGNYYSANFRDHRKHL